MRYSVVATSVAVLLSMACAEGVGLQDPSPEPESILGTISGQVRGELDGQPIAGARVRVEPGSIETSSDAEGRYAIENVPVGSEATPYILRIFGDGFDTVTAAIVLTKAEPVVSFDVELSWRDEDPPLETFDIFQYQVGVWTLSPTTELIFDIQNSSVSAISDLVVIDTLDAEFGHHIVSEDITINSALFPSATVTIGPDGRSFRLELGSLMSTQGFARAFSLTVPTPRGNGVFCNRALASGFAGSEPVTDVEIFCLTTTAGN